MFFVFVESTVTRRMSVKSEGFCHECNCVWRFSRGMGRWIFLISLMQQNGTGKVASLISLARCKKYFWTWSLVISTSRMDWHNNVNNKNREKTQWWKGFLQLQSKRKASQVRWWGVVKHLIVFSCCCCWEFCCVHVFSQSLFISHKSHGLVTHANLANKTKNTRPLNLITSRQINFIIHIVPSPPQCYKCVRDVFVFSEKKNPLLFIF